jgi:hypothetical protein
MMVINSNFSHELTPSPSLLRKEGVQYSVLQVSPPLYEVERGIKGVSSWRTDGKTISAE